MWLLYDLDGWLKFSGEPELFSEMYYRISYGGIIHVCNIYIYTFRLQSELSNTRLIHDMCAWKQHRLDVNCLLFRAVFDHVNEAYPADICGGSGWTAIISREDSVGNMWHPADFIRIFIHYAITSKA